MTSVTILLCPPGPWSKHDSAELLEDIKMREKVLKCTQWPQWPFFSVPGPWSEHDSAELLRLPAPVRSLPLLLWLLRVPQPGHDPTQRGRHRRAPPQQVLDVSRLYVFAWIAWLIALSVCLIDFTVFLIDRFTLFLPVYWPSPPQQVLDVSLFVVALIA